MTTIIMKSVMLVALLSVASTFSADTAKSINNVIDEPRSSFAAAAAANNNNNNLNNVNAHSRSSPMVYAQNRDSYVQAAAQSNGGYSGGGTGGGGIPGGGISGAYGIPVTGGGSSGAYGAPNNNGQGSMTYYYYHYPAAQAGGGGYGDTTGTGQHGYTDDDLGFDGAGLGGLAGLLGLKGLKGLGGLGLLALLKLLKPLLLPLLLPLLFLLPLLLLFIPIPVITIPTAAGRSFQNEGIGHAVSEKVSNTIQLAQDVLTSGQCIEKVACEISRRSQGTYVDKLITGVFEKAETYLSKKWRRGMRAYIDSGFQPESQIKCAKYSCDLYREFSTRISNETDIHLQENI